MSTPASGAVAKLAGLRRPMFGRPVWTASRPASGDADFFDRSDETLATIAAREKAIKEGRAAREDLKSLQDEPRPGKKRKLSSERETEEENGAESSSKHLDSSTEAQQSHLKGSVSSTAVPSGSETRVARGTVVDVVPEQASPRALGRKTPPSAPSISNIIDLDNISSGAGKAPTESNPVPIAEEVEEESEEEFPELARQAREKARAVQLQKSAALTSAGPSSDTSLGSRGTCRNAEDPAAATDTAVTILVTSDMPDTQPLAVMRMLGQRLKEVRLAWCERQRFSKELIESIVLVWAGTLLYDTTTCRSLGIGIDRHGHVVTKGELDALGDTNRQVHMEAMTMNRFQELKKEKLQRAAAKATHEEEPEPQHTAPAAETVRIRIILRARGFDDFKLIVKPSTHIARLISAFRSGNQISADRDVHLMFDGERLESSTIVGETDLGDMDYIDVYVKDAAITI